MSQEPDSATAQPEPDTDPARSPEAKNFAAHRDEIQKAVAQWLNVKVALYRAKGRRLLLVVALVVVAVIVAITVLVTATASFVHGLAGGIGHWAGGRLWLGQLLAPLLILGAVALIVWFQTKREAARRMRALQKKAPVAEAIRHVSPVGYDANGKDDRN